MTRMTDEELELVDAAATIVADREVFADDGAICAYTAERCWRVGSDEEDGATDGCRSFTSISPASPGIGAET